MIEHPCLDKAELCDGHIHPVSAALDGQNKSFTTKSVRLLLPRGLDRRGDVDEFLWYRVTLQA